jgi:hypothetical protein
VSASTRQFIADDGASIRQRMEELRREYAEQLAKATHEHKVRDDAEAEKAKNAAKETTT